MVTDFCAGAGGKTLAIGAGMRNTGRLYAFDTSAHRLDALKPRLGKPLRGGTGGRDAILHASSERVSTQRVRRARHRTLFGIGHSSSLQTHFAIRYCVVHRIRREQGHVCAAWCVCVGLRIRI